MAGNYLSRWAVGGFRKVIEELSSSGQLKLVLSFCVLTIYYLCYGNSFTMCFRHPRGYQLVHYRLHLVKPSPTSILVWDRMAKEEAHRVQAVF